MYYPEQRHIVEITNILRERHLPEDAIGSVEAKVGQRVDLGTVIARGTVPARYIIIEGAQFFRLKNPADLADLAVVEQGEAVEEGQTLALQSERRGKTLVSPVTGIVALIGEGRFILQETPELIDLTAGLSGEVIHVEPGRGALIEAAGGLIQGVWGNGRSTIGVLRLEPEGGLEAIYGDQIDIAYRGAIVITRRPLKASGLLIMTDQAINGVIAPSMDADLRDQARQIRGAVMLTEGFGALRMNGTAQSLLERMVGRQTTIDAVNPNRWEVRRPEVIINLPVRSDQRPQRLNRAQTLNAGMAVRLTRSPHEGQTGQVVDLPKAPVMLDNGLRVQCARVKLTTGETVAVPLANLELFGR
ncbi:MAG: hypothetical protein H7175_13100 [Burkholderiales bacterium]|nr:hypothetical protein [Anaerolineae bacterium]